jgi:hypothetical protein
MGTTSIVQSGMCPVAGATVMHFTLTVVPPQGHLGLAPPDIGLQVISVGPLGRLNVALEVGRLGNSILWDWAL